MAQKLDGLLAVERTWLYQAGKARIAAVCVAIALVLALFHVLIRWFLLNVLNSSGWELAADVLTACLPAALAYKMFVDIRARRREIATRLRTIAELNHQVRNAMDVIQLSAHITKDREAIGLIDSAVARIDRALREVLQDH